MVNLFVEGVQHSEIVSFYSVTRLVMFVATI